LLLLWWAGLLRLGGSSGLGLLQAALAGGAGVPLLQMSQVGRARLLGLLVICVAVFVNSLLSVLDFCNNLRGFPFKEILL